MAMEQLQALAGSQGLHKKKQENLDQFLSSSWHFGVAQLVPFCFFRCRFTLGPSVSEVGVDKLHGIISLQLRRLLLPLLAVSQQSLQLRHLLLLPPQAHRRQRLLC